MAKTIIGLLLILCFLFFYSMLIYMGLSVIFSIGIGKVLEYVFATAYLTGSFCSMLIQLNSLTKKREDDE